ncbi:MAG: fluoride exporter [Solirubrobacteraceae bacterium]|nr:fluoride exporter [Solirubrobacteraceae bacterium]
MRADRSELAAVFAGGFAGAIARAALAEGLPHGGGSWPWATFAANLAGALVLGWVAARLAPASRGRALLGTGFCGALTTFSTMQLELLRMLDGEHLALAAAYALASVAGGLLAVAAGTAAAQRGGGAP